MKVSPAASEIHLLILCTILFPWSLLKKTIGQVTCSTQQLSYLDYRADSSFDFSVALRKV